MKLIKTDQNLLGSNLKTDAVAVTKLPWDYKNVREHFIAWEAD
jgi:hypothetical protein